MVESNKYNLQSKTHDETSFDEPTPTPKTLLKQSVIPNQRPAHLTIIKGNALATLKVL